jgi:hypothetical protein
VAGLGSRRVAPALPDIAVHYGTHAGPLRSIHVQQVLAAIELLAAIEPRPGWSAIAGPYGRHAGQLRLNQARMVRNSWTLHLSLISSSFRAFASAWARSQHRHVRLRKARSGWSAIAGPYTSLISTSFVTFALMGRRQRGPMLSNFAVLWVVPRLANPCDFAIGKSFAFMENGSMIEERQDSDCTLKLRFLQKRVRNRDGRLVLAHREVF